MKISILPYFSFHIDCLPWLVKLATDLVTVEEEDSGHVNTESLLPARGVSTTLLTISVH